MNPFAAAKDADIPFAKRMLALFAAGFVCATILAVAGFLGTMVPAYLLYHVHGAPYWWAQCAGSFVVAAFGGFATSLAAEGAPAMLESFASIRKPGWLMWSYRAFAAPGALFLLWASMRGQADSESTPWAVVCALLGLALAWNWDNMAERRRISGKPSPSG